LAIVYYFIFQKHLISGTQILQQAIEYDFKILDERYKINDKLTRKHLPTFNFRMSLDYGVLDLALVGDYSQTDLFGSKLNLCSKINSSFSISNEIIIGDKLYKVLKSSNIVNNYYFINNGEYKLTETNRYPTYNIRRTNNYVISITKNNNKKDFLEE
jgi:hypothetical protein